MSELRKAAEKALEIFDWLERRSIYQDMELKKVHQELKKALSAPEKEWVGLTKKERNDIWMQHYDGWGQQIKVGWDKAIEQRLREKNS